MNNTSLDTIIAGPILRHVSATQMCLWLVTSQDMDIKVLLCDQNKNNIWQQVLNSEQKKTIKVGKHAFIQQLDIRIEHALPLEQTIYYDIQLNQDNTFTGLAHLLPDISYDNCDLPSFEIKPKVNELYHGSCRKPHHPGDDALVRLDNLIGERVGSKLARPSLLMMSGDQIYADDAAGPMLVAIHQVMNMLGLFDEQWHGSIANNSQALLAHPHCYYQRELLLPHDEANQKLYETFIAAKRKPIFTSVNARNHLISLSELIAMYLLVWSPSLWRLVDFSDHNISTEFLAKYEQEKNVIEHFVKGLAKVRRALAHLPVYMIFDDHDVTDDWNLTRGWEETAYGHPFSKRIIGNALIAYWLCQGWGNNPDNLALLSEQAQQHFQDQGVKEHDKLVDMMLKWNHWHYCLDTQPKVVVLDTRTQRWRSESKLNKPSGLMDWESLCELQQELINQPSVIMVSAAPIFGVKLIETVQKIFTFFGQALMVDAENWMAHKGTAEVILNVFRHFKTPPHFIILSGDVHYSFFYDVTLRFRRSSPQITQFTCSGLKNEFPRKLLSWFDYLNQVLYARRSPLNWFTQRRNMSIKVRHPNKHIGKTLVNQSGLGYLHLDDNSEIVSAKILAANGKDVEFQKK